MKNTNVTWGALFLTFVLSAVFKPALFFVFVGMAVVVASVHAIVFQKKLSRSGIQTTATILSFNTSRRGHKTPVVRFSAAGGRTVVNEPSIHASTDFSLFRNYAALIGTEVEVLYHPDNPRKFILYPAKTMNLAALFLAIATGMPFAIGGFVAIVKGTEIHTLWK